MTIGALMEFLSQHSSHREVSVKDSKLGYVKLEITNIGLGGIDIKDDNCPLFDKLKKEWPE